MNEDIFNNKRLDPMLIKDEVEPFDDIDYIYELKLDGTRCLAYLDEHETDLRNKRYVYLTPIFPELKEIHKQVKNRCILDGELIVQGKDGKPIFSEMQRRCLMSNPIKVSIASKKLPATFVAYDIIYRDNELLTDLPLTERKKILEDTIIENDRISVSRFIEEQGISMFELTTKQNLEGIVAKKKDSKYYFGKRTKDWVKIKNMCDDDFIIVGYMLKKDYHRTLVLAQLNDNKEFIYKGHVSGISKEVFERVSSTDKGRNPFLYEIHDSNKDVTWIKPELVGKVEYMHKTERGFLRQPVFRGLRDDKEIEDCITKE